MSYVLLIIWIALIVASYTAAEYLLEKTGDL